MTQVPWGWNGSAVTAHAPSGLDLPGFDVVMGSPVILFELGKAYVVGQAGRKVRPARCSCRGLPAGREVHSGVGLPLLQHTSSHGTCHRVTDRLGTRVLGSTFAVP